MSYNYARYLDKVAKAGEDQYPLPHYTNVWLNYTGEDVNEIPHLRRR